MCNWDMAFHVFPFVYYSHPPKKKKKSKKKEMMSALFPALSHCINLSCYHVCKIMLLGLHDCESN